METDPYGALVARPSRGHHDVVFEVETDPHGVYHSPTVHSAHQQTNSVKFTGIASEWGSGVIEGPVRGRKILHACTDNY